MKIATCTTILCIALLLGALVIFDGSLFIHMVQAVVENFCLLDVELIQVVKDAKLLITDKPTAFRIHVYSTFDYYHFDVNVTYDFGSRWLLSRDIPIKRGNNWIYIPGGPVIYDSGQSRVWGSTTCVNWTRAGLDDKIEVVIDPFNEVDEFDETDNRKTISARFVDTKWLRILVAPLGCDPADWYSDLWDNMQFLVDTYPVAPKFNRFSWSMLSPISYNPDIPLDEYARYLSTQARILHYDRVVIVRAWGRWSLGGKAIGMLREPEDRVPVVVNCDLFRYDEELVAHEIGHTYYLWHPHDIGPPVYEATRYCVRTGEYEQTANTFMSYNPGPWWIDKGRFDSDSRTWIDLRALGYDTEVEGTWQWNLLDQFIELEVPEPVTVIVMGGLIFSNGTIKLDPWYFIPEGTPDLLPQAVAPQKGDYGIFMLGKDRQVLSQLNFNASFTYLMDLNGTLTKAETNAVPFLFNVPYVNGTYYIQIRNAEGEVLQERAITANPPVVNVTFPNGGESLNIGDNYTISWEAYDLDGDELSYLVSYSQDGGGTWIPLANNLKETSYVWNTTSLTAGDKYLIRVLATDGVNTGEDTSDGTFTTVDLTPPIISNVMQNPYADVVQPDQNVTVYADIFDLNSGVKNASLSYRYSQNNGLTWSPWTNTTMNLETRNTFKGFIPSFQYGTLVQYMILAEDNSNNIATNDNMGQYYIYTVIPENPSITTLTLLMSLVTVATILTRRKIKKRT
jgi:hypothetical protein